MRIFYLSDCTSIHDFRFLYKFVEKRYDTHAIAFVDDYQRLEGIEYHQIHFPDLFFRSPTRLMRSKKEFQKLIDRYEPDVIHTGWVPSYGFLAAYTDKHPLLLMPWGSDILIKPKDLFNFGESPLSIFNNIATKFAIKKADMITCDAMHVKNEIIRLSGYPAEKIIVFPQGIDLSKFNTSADGFSIREELGWQDKKVLIMTRSFSPVYGVEYFLRAIPNIIKENPEVRVILCGDGPLGMDFKRFVSENKLKDYVHFAGVVKNDDLPRYYAASDIYVSCSLSDGTSLSLLEAMACGLPVVVTDVPAIMEWVTDGENGFVVPRKNSIILAEKIIELSKNEELIDKFRERNIRIAGEMADWDRNFEKLEWIQAFE